jgi:cytochrome c-type biogenesis protein CcmH/NrfF
MSYPKETAMNENMECPKCGKKNIVKSSATLYECIACDFKRDLSESSETEDSNPSALWALIAGGAIALLAL